MVIFTMPPPASPMTSMLAISAWAFCMFSCMAWACFIRLLKLPRIAPLTCGAARRRLSLKHSFYRPHRVRQYRGTEPLAQSLDAGILIECAPCGRELRLAGAPLRLRGSLGTRRGARLEFEPHGRSEMARQCLRELLLRRHGAHQLVARVEPETDQGASAAKEDAVSRELPRGARQLELGDDRRPGRALLGCGGGSGGG